MKFGRHKIRKSISAWFDWEIHKVRPFSNHDLFIYKLCTPFYEHTNVYLYLVG